jgi:hypothetical protein
MRNLLMIVLVAIALLCVCRPVVAAEELLGFYSEPNATIKFVVVNAVDGNVLTKKAGDANYAFTRVNEQAGMTFDVNQSIACVNTNRHNLGIFFATMPAGTPACRYYALLIKDANQVVYTSPLKRWDGTTNYINDITTIKGQDPNQVIYNVNRKQYNPGLTAQ